MLLYKQIKKINKEYAKRTLSGLLKEDVPNGDPTTTTTISKKEKGKYVIREREKMVFCGSTIIKNAFTRAVKIKMDTQDGDPLKANTEIAHIYGNKREILTKERLVLNMIQHLSGISTNTNKYVKKFVITESTYLHSGREKKLNFDLKNFSKFKDKIEYIVVDQPPKGIETINQNDNIDLKNKNQQS